MLKEFESHPALASWEEGDTTADQHWVDHHPVLVDQTRRGDLGSEQGNRCH